jgi:threo-3-hydroxy-L-aspartate ammonia-lyase
LSVLIYILFVGHDYFLVASNDSHFAAFIGILCLLDYSSGIDLVAETDILDSIPIGPEDIRLAAERLAPWVHRTPALTSRTLDGLCGGSVFLKCENLQRVGAFKFRGATNALLQLGDDERKAGVITHSSGNHAQALALAGQLLGIPVCVVMPKTAPAVKRMATQGYGAQIVLCEPTLASRESTTADLVTRHGYTLIHPFDNWHVIAGQGTATWELLEQAGQLDLVITPVGGGGLLSGTALACQAKSQQTRVIGAEPERADDAHRSLLEGTILPSNNPRTVADGLLTSLSPRTFAVIRRHVQEIVTVSEADILAAMSFVWERLKIIIEPSSAVAVAPVLNGKVSVRGLRAGIILSGGNVELDVFFERLAEKWC